MSEFDAFRTRDAFNAGTKLPLSLPDGSPSEHWVVVRNYRSDAYTKALGDLQKRIADKGAPDAAQSQRDRLDLLASLVAGWSFEAECTPANVRDFLADAQLVAEAIDRFAMEDERFFGDASKPSTDGPKPK